MPSTNLVRFGTPSNFFFKLGFQKGLFIDFALRQGLKQPLPNFFFMIGIQTWFELSINYFEDFWVEWKKEVSYFFQGFKLEHS
jgi:hypothetical protein